MIVALEQETLIFINDSQRGPG